MGGRLLRPLQFLWRRLVIVLLLPVVVPAALLLAVNSEAGRDLVGAAVETLSGGQVLVDGLGGVLPHRPRAKRLELRDGEGTWLQAEDAALDLAPLALLRGEIVVDSLRAGSVRLLRRPVRPDPTPNRSFRPGPSGSSASRSPGSHWTRSCPARPSSRSTATPSRTVPAT